MALAETPDCIVFVEKFDFVGKNLDFVVLVGNPDFMVLIVLPSFFILAFITNKYNAR